MNSAFRGVPRLGKNLFQSRQLICKSGFNWNRSLFVGQCLSMEHLEKNAFYEKYAHKLKTLQKEQPDVFEERVQQLEAKRASDAAAPMTVEDLVVNAVPNAEAGDQQTAANSATSTASQAATNSNSEQHAASSSTQQDNSAADPVAEKSLRKLDEVMKIELLQDKTAEEISQIWTEYHGSKKCVFAVIPTIEYGDMLTKFQQFPLFAYPIPRGSGYEFFVQRFVGNTCYFTTLDMYKKHGDNAFPCLAMSHYTEFEHSKGIVLMHGAPDTKTLSVHEAQLLALQVKMYYGVTSGVKFNLVRQFNNSPSTFRFTDLLNEFENFKKDARSRREEIDAK